MRETSRITAASGDQQVRHSIEISSCVKASTIGCRVTLVATQCMNFRPLTCHRAARIRDFRGLSPRKFDGRGNYTFGIAEQTIFGNRIGQNQADAGKWTSRCDQRPTTRKRLGSAED